MVSTTLNQAKRSSIPTACFGLSLLSVNAKQSTLTELEITLVGEIYLLASSSYAVDDYYRNALRVSAPKKPGAPRPPRQTTVYLYNEKEKIEYTMLSS